MEQVGEADPLHELRAHAVGVDDRGVGRSRPAEAGALRIDGAGA
jgi:hypothetical protein